jgi:hypothetical protein
MTKPLWEIHEINTEKLAMTIKETGVQLAFGFHLKMKGSQFRFTWLVDSKQSSTLYLYEIIST